MRFRYLSTVLLAVFIYTGSNAQNQKETKVLPPVSTDMFSSSSSHWYGIHDDSNIINPADHQPRYQENEITKIADNIVLFQRDNGGWPKNYDMQAILTHEQVDSLVKTKSKLHTTFDNSTTYTHIEYLSQVYTLTHIEKYKESCLKGFGFVFSAQYPNGGWPQYFPLQDNYSRRITFNDGVFCGIMELLRKVIDNNPYFSFVGDDVRGKAGIAFEKGLDCILKAQIVDSGRLTAWCQQHHEVDLQPAWARAFEPPSICNGESVPIVLLLMSIDNPGVSIIQSVQSAVKWFNDSKIHHTRVKTITVLPEKSAWKTITYDRIVVNDSLAPPIWTRYYELGTDRPLFCDRDSMFLYSLAEVSLERRNGYAWYTYAPQEVLDKYPEWQKKWAPVPAVNEPDIPGYTVSVADFGAVGDGHTLNTKAIADAINAVSNKGGGRVVFPRGLWLTGPIILKSNINIHTDEGALVIFSPDKDLYPLIETSFEGLNTVRCTSPIYGKDLENIAFTGKGIFDGSGEAWRPVKKEKLTESQWKNLVKSGGIVSNDGKTWYPSETYLEGQKISSMNVPTQFSKLEDFEKIKDFLRPVMVSLVNCKKVLIDGPVFQNSPAWCLHPLMCEDLTIRNVTVKNPWYSQNGDGLDIESCRNSIVYNCNFDVGDDAICIKSGKDEDGRKRAMPTENLVVKNCIVYHGHGGVTIGSEMSGGVRTVYVSGCTFIGTDVGLRFKSNRGRGGIVENIHFSDIDMMNIPTQAISFNLYYGGLSVSEMLAEGKNGETTIEEVPPVTIETPLFRDITFKNVRCKGAYQAIFLQGLPEMNLENISFENIDMEADNGLTCIDANGISVKGMRIVTKNVTALSFLNSQHIDIERLDVPKSQNPYIVIKGEKSKQITIRSTNPGDNKSKAVIGDEVDAGSIEIQ